MLVLQFHYANYWFAFLYNVLGVRVTTTDLAMVLTIMFDDLAELLLFKAKRSFPLHVDRYTVLRALIMVGRYHCTFLLCIVLSALSKSQAMYIPN